MSYLSELLAKYKNASAPDIGLINAGVRDHNENAEAHPDVRSELSDVGAQLSAIGKVYDTNGEAMTSVWIGSQAEYDAIDPKDADTLYLIEEAVE